MIKAPIYKSKQGEHMKVACFMSGFGTNTRKIIESGLKSASSYKVVLIYTDVRDDRLTKTGEKMCRAKDIANEYDVNYECVDIRDFYAARGVKRTDLSIRPEFDRMVLDAIRPYRIDLIANSGYMSIMTMPILDEFDGRIINVHPADLTIRSGDERKYVGIHVVRDAILNGETELRATSHVVREKVDHGEILVVSEPVKVQLLQGTTVETLKEDEALLNKVVEEHQYKLKERGDWVIYPLTIQLIGEGRIGLKNGIAYLDGKPKPNGIRL
jgi:folate-dependent phosphoribosylglycinamide formyltransferase PurN